MVKRFIWAIRVREHNCRGQRIQYVLACEQNLHLSIPTIYEILAERDFVRARGRRNKPWGAVPTTTSPRGVIQMDTAAFGEVFAFTGVDIDAKEADVVLRPGLTSEEGTVFLHTAMTRRFTRLVQIVQTDGGPEFKQVLGKTTVKDEPRQFGHLIEHSVIPACLQERRELRPCTLLGIEFDQLGCCRIRMSHVRRGAKRSRVQSRKKGLRKTGIGIVEREGFQGSVSHDSVYHDTLVLHHSQVGTVKLAQGIKRVVSRGN